MAAEFWRFDTEAGAVLARGPTLVRTARVRHGRLALRGDTSADTTLEIYAPSSVCQVTWNGRTVRTSGRADPVKGPLTAHLAGPAPVTLPALDWRHRFGTPEAEPEFDDFHWTLADHLISQNAEAGASTPVLGADEYGFHHGHTWYRGHFTAYGSETDLFLNGSTGNSTGQYAVWLNGAYLGIGNGGTTFPIPAATLRPGEDNVVSVLIANMGHDQGNGKIQRGLVSARLFGSPATLTWRVQGALGGEELIDPVRGAMNRGGLHGERAGWHLPGFTDAGWDRVSLPHSGGRPGVAWYRSRFQLDLPRGQDVPIALRFADDPARRYRAQIYLNGWNLGLYVNHVGPQREFVLPAGLVRAAGENTLALAVWSDDASGGLGPVSLVIQGNVRGGVPVADVHSPRFDPRKYVERPAPAHLVLAGPDLLPRGGTAVVTATLELPGDRRPVTGGALTLSVPEGWQIAGEPTVVVGRLRPGESITAEWSVTAAVGDQPATTILIARAQLDVRGEPRSVSSGKTLAVPPPPPSGDQFVSDLPFQSTNGWGPVERDTSNGEQAAGDGRPISLGGVVHARGLGAHASGTITVYLGGSCSSFTTVVGIDDEAGNAGSVRFRVRVDNREVASTDVLTGAMAPVALDADITGGEWLELVLDEAGDGNGVDHADWADAVIHCR